MIQFPGRAIGNIRSEKWENSKQTLCSDANFLLLTLISPFPEGWQQKLQFPSNQVFWHTSKDRNVLIPPQSWRKVISRLFLFGLEWWLSYGRWFSLEISSKWAEDDGDWETAEPFNPFGTTTHFKVKPFISILQTHMTLEIILHNASWTTGVKLVCTKVSVMF